jgi:hypothetical protein
MWPRRGQQDLRRHGLRRHVGTWSDVERLEYTKYTLEQLELEGVRDELIEIYDEYDAKAEGVTDRDELVMLLAQRQGDLAQVILMHRSIEQMMGQGIPAGIYRRSMSALDKAYFPDKETYLDHMNRSR